MYKSKAKLFAVTFILFVVSIFFMNNIFASDETAEWKVTITNDTKELRETQEIIFKFEDNQSVVSGKFAPGVRAIATIEINLIGTKLPVDIMATIDDSKLSEQFRLTVKLDDEIYMSNIVKTLNFEDGEGFTEKDGKRILTLELEWNDANSDNIIGITANSIEIPVRIDVKQHI